jgi:hypothetical protein
MKRAVQQQAQQASAAASSRPSSSSRKQKNSPQSAVIRPFRTAIRAAAAAAVNGSDTSVNAWLSLRLRAIHDDGSNHEPWTDDSTKPLQRLQTGAASRFSADRGLVAALAALALGWRFTHLSTARDSWASRCFRARVLLSGEAVRIDWAALLGPALASLLVGIFVGLPGAIGTLFVWRLFADTRWSTAEATFAWLQPPAARLKRHSKHWRMRG